MANVTIGDLPKKEELLGDYKLEVETSEDSGHVEIQQIVDASVDAVQEQVNGKVDKEDGRGLTDENFSSEEKQKLESLQNYDDSEVISSLSNKVDKEEGKGLSTEDYTTTEKQKLESLQNYDDSSLNARIDEVEDGLEGKVDKVSGKGLSDQNYTSEEKQKLEILQNYDDSDVRDLISDKVDKEEGKKLTDENYSLEEKQKLEILQNYDDSDVRDLISDKVDKETGKGLSTEDFSTDEKSKLASLENFDDSDIRTALQGKVDKVSGKGLSTNDLTDELYDKLASQESSKYKGDYTNEAALRAAHPTADPGSYANVDPGEGEVAVRWIWDESDQDWIDTGGKAEPLTAAQVKQLYESNPNTEGFTPALKDKLESLQNYDDSAILNSLGNKVDKISGRGLSTENYSTEDKNKLAGVAVEATKNESDSHLKNRSNHTGTQGMETIEGLGTVLGTKVDEDDERLTNSREWTASIVTQAEAEAGTATTARKWTAQRVRQAILGWWNASTFKTKLDGIEDGATKNATDAQLRSRDTHTGAQPISSVTNLQSSLDSKVDKQTGYGLSQENYTPAEKSKLSGVQDGATANATDVQLRDRATHTGVQPINTVAGLQGELDDINLLIGDVASALDAINGEVV